jgi:hypothetical protein
MARVDSRNLTSAFDLSLFFNGTPLHCASGKTVKCENLSISIIEIITSKENAVNIISPIFLDNLSIVMTKKNG